MMKTFISIIAICSMVLAGSQPARQILDREEKIQKLDHRKDKLLDALVKINTKNKKLTYDLDKLTKEKEMLEVDLEQNIKEIKSISAKLIETRKMLTERIKTLGKIKGENILKSMLMFPKISQIEKNIKMMGIIAAYDVTSVQDYYNDRIKLKDKIEKSKNRIASIKELGASISAKKDKLDQEYLVKAKFLDSIKKSRILNISELKKLKNKHRDLNIDDSGILDFLTSNSLLTQKGNLLSPINGKIEEKFGFQNYEDYSSFKNLGVFIGSNLNQKVNAIYTGKVIELGFLNGLGTFLILDHGDNYYSIYGNIKELKVKKGDLAKTGQVIAKADDQYIDHQTGLYFELRHYSKVLNPQQWIGGWNEAGN
ncbi:MAG: peptidoglycan DD-metalloendopeptidase family protein [Bdellovibrionales bacterium]|nr:peptidoglycan DD-metalloendopeptidase family protein [Bdellovibrionales bacterium]